MFRAVVALLVVCSVLATGVAPVTGSVADSGMSSDSLADATAAERSPALAASTTRTLDLTTSYQLTPSRPGEVLVTLHYEIPSTVTAVETRIPENATVTSTTGFARESDRLYAWQGTSRSADLTYRLAVNETAGGRLPLAAEGEYLFADPGPWALFRRPSTGTRWEWRTGDVELTRRSVVEEGVVSDQLVFLGPVEEYRRQANGQTFRLVVPEAATLAESPMALLDSFADASGRLDVGDRDREVVVVAAPTAGVEWGVRGLQTGESDIWVRDTEPLSTPNNVWLHEYVHSRQSYQPTRETRWFTEGSATYYAALLTLEQGYVGYDAFESWLALGANDPAGSTVLSQPATWGVEGDYRKGALVAGALDYRIRGAGEESLATVFADANGHDGPLSAADLRGFVSAAGNESAAEATERYTTTNATPATWPLSAHIDRFGAFPGHITAEFVVADDTPAVVSGPYRNASVTESAGTLVVPNETLSLPVAVRNDGGQPKAYELTFTVGTGTERLNGTLDPGERRIERLNRTFEETGTYTLTAGTDRYTVFVREPAVAQVVDVSVSAAEVAVGEPVTVTATVQNDGARPGETTVAFTLDGERVAERRVTLDAGEETTVSATVVPEEPGMVDVGTDRMTVAVEVVADTATAVPTADGTTTTSPGFGVGVALVALAVSVVAALAQKSRQ